MNLFNLSREGHAAINHQNERGQSRYTVSPVARREILRRLFAMNLEITAHEAAKAGTIDQRTRERNRQ